MEKLTFTITIHAPREKVWSTMLSKGTYEAWTAAFQEGSTYEGSFDEGSEISFIGPSEDGNISGMYAVIAVHRPHEFVSIVHKGELKNGEKIPWSGAEGYENYTFSEVNGSTELKIDLQIPTEWKDMFADMWPKALMKLKEIVER
ncbi:MAG: SRPBCC domain-containing protein [Candidatus Taylorbacteria bacterium]|nr:SRPBCC domain-containing protein [Candidatus Taylorbacteria bacterium]